MLEAQSHPFTRTYKYRSKNQTAFSSSFKLAPGSVLNCRMEREFLAKTKQVSIQKDQTKIAIEKPLRQEIQDHPLLKYEKDLDGQFQSSESEEQIVHTKQAKKHFKNERHKVEMTLEDLDIMRAYQKVDLKNVKIVEKGIKRKKRDKKFEDYEQETREPRRKKKYVKTEQKKKSYRDNNERKQRYKPERYFTKTEEKQALITYDEYLSLQAVENANKDSQIKYYRGRVEYGQGPKWRGKIVCDDLEGTLLIEGKHRNRSLHDDKVYFQIMNKEGEKTYCNIVHIIQEKRQIIGRIDFLAGKRQYVINPINSRIVGMNVENDSVTKQMNRMKDTHYFRAEYIGWAIDSQYPLCRVTEVFGPFGDIEIETTALLKTHNVEDVQHDPQLVKTDLAKFLSRMNNKGQYEIAQEDINKREDLRKNRIFTIDPVNARDFDDALSVEANTDGTFKIGVHIADASFFCEQGSLVDKEARKRTTSVYLVHRVIPMLPRLLCQNFCSLNPGCERLTFTLWLKVDKKGQVLGQPKVTRSVIKSCARFTYEQAQKIIEGTIKSQADIEQGFGCVNSSDFDIIAQDIKHMHGLAVELRKKRVKRGSLFFNIPRKVFQLNEEKMPLEFKIYERKEAHFLVEEFMILANEIVGEILVKETHDKALLRRHKFPGPKKIARYEQFMKNIGLPLKFTQETRVQDTINQVLAKEDIKQSIKDLVKYEMIGLLQTADYFLVGKSAPHTWIHYALNAPVYTHFTSPIRRYPDILVHRQLASILEGQQENARIKNDLIQLCNEKKLMAKRVSTGCEKIFMCLYLKEKHADVKGIITEIDDWGFKICVTSFDFKGTLRFKQIQGLRVTSVDQDVEKRKTLHLQYKGKVNIKFSIKQYEELQLRLGCKEGFPMDYRIAILRGDPRKPNQQIVIG